MATRDKDGQLLLGDFLRAYGATPIITEGNLPGGGALFEECARAVEPAPEQTEIPRPLQVGDRVRVVGATRTKRGHVGTVEAFKDGRTCVLFEIDVYTGHTRKQRSWFEAGDLEVSDG